jgi:hypothetical protein
VSVPYPGTASRSRSQNDDHLAGLATRYIEQNLDKTVGWDEVRQYLKTQHGKTSTESACGLLLAVLDLEWTGAIQYDVDRFWRPGPPTDAKFDIPIRCRSSLSCARPWRSTTASWTPARWTASWYDRRRVASTEVG